LHPYAIQKLRGAAQRPPKKVIKTGQLYILLRCIIVAKQLGHPPNGPRV